MQNFSLWEVFSLASWCHILQSDAYHFLCRFDKISFGLADDLFVCFVYIPPSDSIWFKSGRSLNFDILQDERANYDAKGLILILGDFNGRTGTLPDFIVNDSVDDFLPVANDYSPDTALITRQSSDNTINHSSRLLIEFCKTEGLRILNGHTDKNRSSHFSCFTSNGNSTVDDTLANEKTFGLISCLKVGNMSSLSDHSPIEISTKQSVNGNNSTVSSSKPDNVSSLAVDVLMSNYTKQYIPSFDSHQKIQLLIENDNTLAFLENLETDLDDKSIPVGHTVALMRQHLTQIAEGCFRTKKNFSSNVPKKKHFVWFYNECKSSKKLLSTSCKDLQAALRRNKPDPIRSYT